MHSLSANLFLDPGSVVVPSKGALYVFNRKGFTTIEASHIDEVHEKVKKYLDGNYTEDELLTAVPTDKQPVLRKYFDAMGQAGALQNDRTPNPVPELRVEEIAGDGCSLLFEAAGGSTWVSLDGKNHAADSASGCDAQLLFVSPAEMEVEWGRLWCRNRHEAHHIYIVSENHSAEPLTQSELDQRRRYAAWLVCALRMDLWDNKGLRIYSFDVANPSLSRSFSASLTATKSGFELTTPTEHSQAPLVLAKAEVPFYSQEVTGCGLDYSQLSRELEQEFTARAVISSQSRDGEITCITESKSCASSKPILQRTKIACEQVLMWPVAGSLLDLRVRSLERFCHALVEKSPHGIGRKTDLLQMQDKHPQIAYLASLLQMRMQTLPSTLETTAYDLHVCSAGGHKAYSFVQAKAMRDVMLAMAKDMFYGDAVACIPIKHECDFGTFLEEQELCQLTARQGELLDEKRVSRKFTFKHVKRFGISTWTGDFSHAD